MATKITLLVFYKKY